MSFAHSGSITRILAYLGEPAGAAHRPRPPAVLPGRRTRYARRRYVAQMNGAVDGLAEIEVGALGERTPLRAARRGGSTAERAGRPATA